MATERSRRSALAHDALAAEALAKSAAAARWRGGDGAAEGEGAEALTANGGGRPGVRVMPLTAATDSKRQ
jgi:hypothetical protein